MMSVIIYACLISDPSVCREHLIPASNSGSSRHCMAHAPPYVAQWSGRQPQWQIKKWHCGTSEIQKLR